MDGPNLISLLRTCRILELEYPPRRKSSRSKSWEGVNSAVKERLSRCPDLPHSAGIQVPGSLPMLNETFHLVSSNKLAILFMDFFFVEDDLSFVSVNTMGAGAGSNSSVVVVVEDVASGVLATVVDSDDDDDDAFEEEDVNFALRSSRRCNASFLNTSISFRNSSDSASISATVLPFAFDGSAMCSFVVVLVGILMRDDGCWYLLRVVENANAVEDAA
mmetsp:Transcript_9867/g.15649  ORF Transcript_9867/g.15649 Transcript_9867/m.15649 type:complete len:218 (+) Transcript_9867:1594-2247(+)